ncbi:CesT family type III secretion system chaperone [Burkholderia ubonensis]|uniref:CesT family type III secretion system chaperone n=1 Tax=Burkholderia ubonensis TaxID=101571 RepID=UPI0007590C16|nr:CesT family type III secretion system chaperone [Burkholderia ubonensis]KVX73725.1 hypothetical protein WL08_18445 [Burkholderia ubonensis]
MNSESLIRDCLKQLGRRNGIAGLTLEVNGCAGIEIQDGRRIYLKFDRERGRVFIYRALFPLHTVDSTTLRRCMALNLLEAQTGGGVLALSDHMDAIIYHKSIAGDKVDVTSLLQAIEVLLADGERLARLLAASV